MAVRKHRETQRFCLECGYALKALTHNVCPECGRTFDPAKPETYASRHRKRNRRLVVVAIYLTSFFFWFMVLIPRSTGMVESSGLWDRIWMGLGHLAGPIELALIILDIVPTTWAAGALVGVFAWCTWIILTSVTRVRNIQYAWHLAGALLWGAFGYLATVVEGFFA